MQALSLLGKYSSMGKFTVAALQLSRKIKTGLIADGGSVRMVADGKVTVSGRVEAKGANAGGNIDISGAKETALVAASVDASGAEKGQIRLGGEFQGGKDLGTVDTTMKSNFVGRFGQQEGLASTAKLTVDSASVISAGNDGIVIGWSEGDSHFYGRFTAKYLETSGKGKVVIPLDTTIGKGGLWLIDPANVTIDNLPGSQNDTTSSHINASWLGSYIGSNYIVIVAGNSISVEENIVWGAFGRGILSLNAPTVSIKSGISIYTYYGSLEIAGSTVSVGNNATIEAGNINIRADILTIEENVVLGGFGKGMLTLNAPTVSIKSGITISTDYGFLEITGSTVSVGNNATIKAGNINIGADILTIGEGIKLHSKRSDGGLRLFGQQSITIGKYADIDGEYILIHSGGGISVAEGSRILGASRVVLWQGSAQHSIQLNGCRIWASASISIFGYNFSAKQSSIETRTGYGGIFFEGIANPAKPDYSGYETNDGFLTLTLDNTRISGSEISVTGKTITITDSTLNAYSFMRISKGDRTTNPHPPSDLTLSGYSYLYSGEKLELYLSSLKFINTIAKTYIYAPQVKIVGSGSNLIGTIPGSFHTIATIKAGEVLFKGSGSYFLGHNAIQTRTLGWEKDVKLRADNSKEFFHILGVKKLLENGSLVQKTDWPFGTVHLQYLSTTVPVKDELGTIDKESLEEKSPATSEFPMTPEDIVAQAMVPTVRNPQYSAKNIALLKNIGINIKPNSRSVISKKLDSIGATIGQPYGSGAYVGECVTLVKALVPELDGITWTNPNTFMNTYGDGSYPAPNGGTFTVGTIPTIGSVFLQNNKWVGHTGIVIDIIDLGDGQIKLVLLDQNDPLGSGVKDTNSVTMSKNGKEGWKFVTTATTESMGQPSLPVETVAQATDMVIGDGKGSGLAKYNEGASIPEQQAALNSFLSGIENSGKWNNTVDAMVYISNIYQIVTGTAPDVGPLTIHVANYIDLKGEAQRQYLVTLATKLQQYLQDKNISTTDN